MSVSALPAKEGVSGGRPKYAPGLLNGGKQGWKKGGLNSEQGSQNQVLLGCSSPRTL